MPASFRLQDLTTSTASESQRLEEAIDIGSYRTVVAHIRRPVAADASPASLYLQHSAVLDVAGFVDVTTTAIPLGYSGSASTVVVYHDLLRYLRWRTAFGYAPTVPPQFLIDVVAREN